MSGVATVLKFEEPLTPPTTPPKSRDEEDRSTTATNDIQQDWRLRKIPQQLEIDQGTYDVVGIVEGGGISLQQPGKLTERLEVSKDDFICLIETPMGEIPAAETEGKSVFHLLRTVSDPSDISSPPQLRATPVNSPSILSSNLNTFFLPTTLPVHLDPRQSEVHIIISTTAGTGLASTYFSSVLQPLLLLLGLTASDYTLHTTSSPTSISTLASSNFQSSPNPNSPRRPVSAVLLGGDTSVFDLLNALPLRKPLALSLLPLGTGNALASSLSLNLRTLLLGRPSPAPLPGFSARFSPSSEFVVHEGLDSASLPPGNTLKGSVVLSWGFHAALVADSDSAEYRKFGAQRFGMAARRGLEGEGGSGPHKYRGEVTLFLKDGGQRVLRGELGHFYLLVAMVPKLEKNFTISPKLLEKEERGKMYVTYFPPLGAERVMEIMNLGYEPGAPKLVEAVRAVEGGVYEEIEGMRLKMEEEEECWRRICVDGKIVRVSHGGYVEARKIGDEQAGIRIVQLS